MLPAGTISLQLFVLQLCVLHTPCLRKMEPALLPSPADGAFEHDDVQNPIRLCRQDMVIVLKLAHNMCVRRRL